MVQPDQDRMFNAELHPRVPAGGHGGGEFGKGSGGSKTKPAPHKAAPHHTTPKGPAKPLGPLTKTLAYDAKTNRGPGYGVKGGDPHVRKIQAELNRLGLTDLGGKKLAVDGQLGPLTTQSIKAAQRRLGLTPNGQVTPALYAKLAATKGLPKAAAAKTVPKPKAEPKRSDLPDGQEPMAEVPNTEVDPPETTQLPDPLPTQTALSDEACEQALMELLADMSEQDIHDLAGATDDALAYGEGY